VSGGDFVIVEVRANISFGKTRLTRAVANKYRHVTIDP